MMDDQSRPPEASDPATAPEPAASSPPLTLGRQIFLGPSGLRAGWALLLYLLIGAAIFSLLMVLNKAAHLNRANLLWALVVSEVELLLAAVAPAFVMARMERRPFAAYGLPLQGDVGKPFWVGTVWGIVALTVLMAAMRGANVFYFGELALHGARILKFAVFWAAFFLLVGLVEEFLLRGYTQFTLTRGIGFWPAAVLLSCAFGGIHLFNKGELWIGALAAAAIGLFFCLTLRRTGTLWFAVGFHASWDWGETYLFSVPNSGTKMAGHLLNSSFQGSPWLSGGSVGPEGSVLCFVVILAAWLVFDRMYPKANYPAT